MTAVVGVLQGVIWPTVWTTILIGIPLGFYLGLGGGKQMGYAARLVLHPISLAHGLCLCPQCNGTGHDGDHICYFCLQDFMAHGTRLGLVSQRRFFKDWQWRGWTRKPVFVYPTAHGTR